MNQTDKLNKISECSMPKGWSRYSPSHRITTEKMQRLGKPVVDWSFRQSEHIESLKQGLPESVIPCKQLPTTKFVRLLATAPDWRQQLTDAWKALNV
jgi:hypothetical protein